MTNKWKKFCDEPIDKIPNPEDYYQVSSSSAIGKLCYMDKLVFCSHDLNNCIKIIDQLLLTVEDKDIISALSWACSYSKLSHPLIIKLLLDNLRVRNILTKKNDVLIKTFLPLCQDYKNDIESVKLFLNCEYIDVNIVNNDGDNAFLLACSYGNFETMKLLLECPKININIMNHYCFTPLAKVYLESHSDTDAIKKMELLIKDPRISIYLPSNKASKKYIFDLINDQELRFYEEREKTSILISNYPYCMHLAVKYLDEIHVNKIYDVIYTNIIALDTKKIQAVCSYMFKHISEDKFYELSDKIYWRNYFTKNIVPKITHHGSLLYWKPGNIIALCKETDFSLDFCDKGKLFIDLNPKLKILLNIKNADDMLNKINYYIENENLID